MSVDIETALRTFFASSPQNIHSIATLEISHSAMSRVFYLWREPYAGQITLDDASVVDVECLNFEVKIAGTDKNLDQAFSIRIDTTDIENEFRDELDSIPIDTTEEVQIIYREYLSDDLTSIQAQVTLEAESLSYTIGAANISAVSPRLNVTRTGEVYTPKEVPMLRGFL